VALGLAQEAEQAAGHGLESDLRIRDGEHALLPDEWSELRRLSAHQTDSRPVPVSR
jgi:hypothetical protein